MDGVIGLLSDIRRDEGTFNQFLIDDVAAFVQCFVYAKIRSIKRTADAMLATQILSRRSALLRQRGG